MGQRQIALKHRFDQCPDVAELGELVAEDSAWNRFPTALVTPPLFQTDTGKPMDRFAADDVVKRIAREAGITKKISAHSLRHGFVTLSLDAGVSLRDVQDSARHADPRTTRRYDRARHSLDRHATYALGAYIG